MQAAELESLMINDQYQFKAKNILGERVHVSLHFREQVIAFPTIQERFILYCTIFVRSGTGKLQYYHGATVWNSSDKFDRYDALFKAFQDALVRRYAQEYRNQEIQLGFAHTHIGTWGYKFLKEVQKPKGIIYQRPWEEYKNYWCSYFWEVVNGTADMVKANKDGKTTTNPIYF